MPVESSKVNIPNGTAVRIAAADNMEQDVAISNANADNSFFIDGTDQVAAATGFPIKAEEALSITLGAGDELWAIAAADGIQANVIIVKAD